jgi:hypothetical protein
MNIRSQLKQNQLAIISLVVALIALGYNTWRNESSETNRNFRQAGFEMLVHVAELQQITFLAHYDNDLIGGNPRKGWTEVLMINDLAMLMPADSPVQTVDLEAAWAKNWNKLGKSDESVEIIDTAINQVRTDILATLQSLD